MKAGEGWDGLEVLIVGLVMAVIGVMFGAIILANPSADIEAVADETFTVRTVYLDDPGIWCAILIAEEPVAISCDWDADDRD